MDVKTFKEIIYLLLENCEDRILVLVYSLFTMWRKSPSYWMAI